MAEEVALVAVADVVVMIPSGLRRFTRELESVDVQAETVGEALRSVTDMYPRLRTQVFTTNHELRRFINIFVNSKDIRFLQQERTPLQSQDVITILPAMAGG